jgi:non-homologous end joining protein Ku
MLRVKRSAASQFSQTNFMDSVAQAAKALIDSQKSRQQKASNAAPMAPLVNIVEQPVSSIGQKRKEPSAMEMLEAAQAVRFVCAFS